MQSDRNAPQTGPDSNVIVMCRYLTDARFAHIATVEAYWHALRGHRVMPRRAEVDPRGIENALEYAFILEQIAPGVGRLRIAGSHLSDLLGMEVRGMPLSAFFMPGTRDELAAVLTTVCDGPSTASLSLQAEPGGGKPALEARMILLPLRDEVGAVSRILGCFDSKGGIGHTPRRFAITSRRLTPITGQDVARNWEHQTDRQGESGVSQGFSESQASFGRATPRALDKPATRHLRLITSQE